MAAFRTSCSRHVCQWRVNRLLQTRLCDLNAPSLGSSQCHSKAGQALAHLYGAMRLYVNHFQPSFKLLDKSRNGGSVRKRYEKPDSPCDRLLRRDDVSEETKQRLRNSRVELDPVSLLHTIREAQSALASIKDSATVSASTSESLEQFLGRLPDLGRQGEVRAPHEADAQKARKPHTWRTRPDPFKGVWCEILDWLQCKPDTTARELLDRLMCRHPERFSRSHPRALQRRVRQWRRVMARELVYASGERSEKIEADQRNIRPVVVN